MEALFAFLSDLVLFLTLSTLVFAVGAYGAMVLRRRVPAHKRRSAAFPASGNLLRRYVPRESD